MARIAVLDIGKTNLKLAVVDLTARAEVAVITAPNRVLPGPPWPHFDVDAQWRFLIDGLRRMVVAHAIDGVTVTTHGACCALLDRDGNLAAPVLDYEHPGPDAQAAAYDALRPDFAETGSPRLPLGLNVGAQLHYMLAVDPRLQDRVAHVVTWPQYWGFRLTGRMACDLSSLGCHTDLWNPSAGRWSTLPARLGLEGKMAPPQRPDAVLGVVSGLVQAETGLGPVPVRVGIHDSNASLLPHLLGRRPPFAVVSTGTWVISMAVGGRQVALDPARDTLVNVSAVGAPVPSARFMGGRDYEVMRPEGAVRAGPADAERVLASGVMLLPSVTPGTGPFPQSAGRWTLEPATPEMREVALGYYLGLMTATCLDLIGAEGPVVVEGPMAANPWLRAMLAAATGRAVVASPAVTGTAIGAALLFHKGVLPDMAAPEPEAGDPRLAAYAARWRELAGR